MGTVLKLKLSAASFQRAAEAVRDYGDSLDAKCRKLRERLAEIGIDTAKSNCGEYAGMIVFEVRNEDPDISYLVATDGKKIVRSWYPSKKSALKGVRQRSYEVSPLLLAEFGSGWLAKVLVNIAGVGQGTMPNSYGHAFDAGGWYWYDESGTKRHSEGEAPTFPMYSASMAMLFEVDRIAKEIFATNEVVVC